MSKTKLGSGKVSLRTSVKKDWMVETWVGTKGKRNSKWFRSRWQMPMSCLSRTKHRNSQDGLTLNHFRNTSTYWMSFFVSRPSAVSSKACSKSWVMKSLDLSNRYISLGVAHSMLFFVMLIQVASLGADQFSFGATSPPSSAIASFIFW